MSAITSEDDAVAVAALLSHQHHAVQAADSAGSRKRVSPNSHLNVHVHKKMRTATATVTTEVPPNEVTLLTTSQFGGANGHTIDAAISQVEASGNSSYNSLKEQLLHGRSTIPSQIKVDPASVLSQAYISQQYNLHGTFPETALRYMGSAATNLVQPVPSKFTATGARVNTANRPFLSQNLNRVNGKKGRAIARKRDPETRRLVHNLAEKRRQHKINEFINQLRQIMFDYSQKVIPKGKAKILQNTVDFIQTLVEDNCTLHKKIGFMCQKNARPANLDDLHWTPAEALAGGKRVLNTLETFGAVELQK